MNTEEQLEEMQGQVVSKTKRLGLTAVDVLLFIALLFLIFTFTLGPLSTVLQSMSEEAVMGHFLLQMMEEALLLISTFLSACIVFYIRKLPLTGLGLSLKGRWKDWLSGLLFIIVLYSIGFGLSLLSGVVEVTGTAFHPSFLLISLVFFLLVGATEELAVRGFILGRMLDGGVNKFVALFLSSVIFSLLHIANPNFAFLPFLNIVLAGFFLGASYLYTRNLCFPIALHWFWNWVQGPVLGYEVSGCRYGDDSMLTLRLPETNLMNGGAFGFEGSILCTILLIVSTTLIICYYERKKGKKA